MGDRENRRPDAAAVQSQGNVQQNRRRNLRSPLIVMQTRLANERKTFFGYAKNISRGGMFIGSVNPQQPGTQFSVEFPLPSRAEVKVRCTCEVVWNRPFSKRGSYEPGMGLRFLDLPDQSAQAIEDWVHEESQ